MAAFGLIAPYDSGYLVNKVVITPKKCRNAFTLAFWLSVGSVDGLKDDL